MNRERETERRNELSEAGRMRTCTSRWVRENRRRVKFESEDDRDVM